MRKSTRTTMATGCCLLLAACGPVSEAERRYREEREPQQLIEPAGPARPAAAGGPEEAIQLVQQHPAQTGSGTVADGVDLMLQAVQGQVMFPQWDVKRRGASHYEVRFTFTILRDDYAIEKKGLSWSVDLNLKTVGPAREFEPEDAVKLPRTPPPRPEPEKDGRDNLNLE